MYQPINFLISKNSDEEIKNKFFKIHFQVSIFQIVFQKTKKETTIENDWILTIADVKGRSKEQLATSLCKKWTHSAVFLFWRSHTKFCSDWVREEELYQMPKQRKSRQRSKTKTWRKLNFKIVEELSIQKTQEVLRGGPLSEKKSEELFFEDKLNASLRKWPKKIRSNFGINFENLNNLFIIFQKN